MRWQHIRLIVLCFLLAAHLESMGALPGEGLLPDKAPAPDQGALPGLVLLADAVFSCQRGSLSGAVSSSDEAATADEASYSGEMSYSGAVFSSDEASSSDEAATSNDVTMSNDVTTADDVTTSDEGFSSDGPSSRDGAPGTNSRRARRAYERALDAWRLYDYAIAVEQLERAVSVDDAFIEAHLLLGEIHHEEGQYDKSIAPYQRALELDASFYPPARFFLGHALYREARYGEAVEVLTSYVEREGLRGESLQRGQDMLGRAVFAAEAVASPVDFHPVDPGPAINSEHSEYSPSLTADEQSLVFTRKKARHAGASHPQRDYFEDFYISYYREGQWTEAVNMGPPLNTPDNEGAQSITADGRHMYFTACNRPDGRGSCDIYYSRRRGDQWSTPVNIGPPVNTSAWESQASISADGNTLYFASNRSGSLGPMDIWKSKRGADGGWSEPVNLGPAINTGGNELSPFIHHDGQSLYFASDGHYGMGGLDLFVSRRGEDGQWSKPQNLGYPVNTRGDEFSLVVGASGRHAWFASNMKGAHGEMDLFHFTLHEEVRPNPHTYMRGLVYDARSGEALEARFELVDLGDGSTITSSVSDPLEGDFLVAIPIGHELALNVSKEGYLFFSEHFSYERQDSLADPYLRNIALQPIEEGKAVVLRNVFFDTDSHILQESSHAELQRLERFLRENPGLRVEISGHTDSTGSFEHNKRLSERRALSVREYLTERDIDEGRISAQGYADTRPVDTNETPEGRANNRRTEFEILPLE